MAEETNPNSGLVLDDAAKAAAAAGGAKPDDKAPEGDKLKGDEGADDKAKGVKDDKAKTGAPETYAEFKVPEGVTLDKGLVAEFSTVAKELGLSQEQAQKLVDLDAKRAAAVAKANVDAFTKVVTDWRVAAAADKEIGGADFDKNVGTALKALDKFGTPELKQDLSKYGFGNHPELLRLLVRVGKTLEEDRPAQEGASTGDRKPLEQRLYKGMNP